MWIKDQYGDLVNLGLASCIYSIFEVQGESDCERPTGHYVYAIVAGSRIRITRALNEADAEAVMYWMEAHASRAPVPSLLEC